METLFIEKLASAYREDMPASVRSLAFAAASIIYKAAGQAKKAATFQKMASCDPGPGANPVACAIHAALGARYAAGLEKEAFAATKNLVMGSLGLAPRIGGVSMDALKYLLLGSGLVGAIGGGGAFATRRALQADSEKLLKLEQERNMMNQLAADVDRELKLRKLDPTPENKAAVVDYIT